MSDYASWRMPPTKSNQDDIVQFLHFLYAYFASSSLPIAEEINMRFQRWNRCVLVYHLVRTLRNVVPDQEHIDTGLDDLDAARLKKLNAGKNASHTRVYTVSGLLQSIRKQIDQTVTDNTPAIARCDITRGNYIYIYIYKYIYIYI